MTGLYYAREARGMSRTELVERSGISKQQLSRLENGHIRLRLDHLKPFAKALGYTPEQMLLWGRYPGTPAAISNQATCCAKKRHMTSRSAPRPGRCRNSTPAPASAAAACRRAKCARTASHADPLKAEGWVFPPTFVREQLHSSPGRLLVLDTTGDSMAPTIMSGERVIVDTGHKTPTPDGLYAIRDTFECIVVKRLQVMRSSRPTRVKIISDNPNHPSEEMPLNELEVVGKVLCCLKLF